MADNMTPEQRSRTMSRIRSRNTASEVALRQALHRRGLRFRIHVRSLPGTPDIVFPAARLAVFVDGDFWHGRHYAAKHAEWKEYWRAKIARNMERDRAADEALAAAGWRVLRIWERDLRSKIELWSGRIEQMVRAPAEQNAARADGADISAPRRPER